MMTFCRFTTVVFGDSTTSATTLSLAIESCGYTRSAAGIYHWSAHPHVGYSSRKGYWVGCLLQSFFDCPVKFGQWLLISTKTMTFDSRDDCNDLIQYMITFDMTSCTASGPCPLCRHTWTGYPNPSKRTSAFDVHGIFKVIDVHYLYTYPTGTQVSIHTLSSWLMCHRGRLPAVWGEISVDRLYDKILYDTILLYIASIYWLWHRMRYDMTWHMRMIWYDDRWCVVM